VRFARLVREVRACTVCAAHLPFAPRPVLRVSATARILIVGQAPGRRVHASGVPWDDPSGDRLRGWLQLSREDFYDEARIAIVPTGMCYPGKGPSGDLPPRRECAPLWHPKLRALMPDIRLTVLVGSYAQAFYLGSRRKDSLAETVRAFGDFLPEFFPLPHPSPRNVGWFQKNPWVEKEVVPEVRRRVGEILESR
jgi:uracil-DNA glycosylase